MNIEDYDIIRETSEEELRKRVKSKMEDGWEPIGGISIMQSEYEDEYNTLRRYIQFCQAMIKTK